jgi:tetratricopeptide (TPR) repeat protein
MIARRVTTALCAALGLAAFAGPAAGAEERPATVADAVVHDEAGALTAAQKEEAKRSVADGRQAYGEGRFQEAADLFEQTYELTHAPELLYNLARCYERLGDNGRAADQYEMYLRMSPDAEDREEVEKKIAELRPAEPETEPLPEKEEGPDILLAIASGLDVPIVAEWERKSVPVDVALLFATNDWLRLGFGLAFVGFVGDKPVSETGFPTGAFALHGDLAALKTIKGRLAFAASLAVAPTWLFREHRDSVFWLAGRLGVGLHIDVWKAFGVLVEAVSAVGPVFNRRPDALDNWPKVSLAVDAGGRLAITYAF